MRSSPLGILSSSGNLSLQEMFNCIEDDCKITHPNKIAIDATKLYCLTIKMAIENYSKVDIYENLVSCCKIILKNDLLLQILTDSKSKPGPTMMQPIEPIKSIKPIEICKVKYTKADGYHIGYLGIALQLAWYELFNGTNFMKSLINVILKGGDTDTNGCIAGSILGAFYGFDSIPKKWVKTVQINKDDNYRLKEYIFIDQSESNLDFLVDELCKL
jgi:ADP-ribosylglycohydrolase